MPCSACLQVRVLQLIVRNLICFISTVGLGWLVATHCQSQVPHNWPGLWRI